jgi:hypothetical protein
VQQSLGWNTTAVQAGSAKLVFLDKGNRLAQLCRAQSRGVATASSTENNDIKIVLSQNGLLDKVS